MIFYAKKAECHFYFQDNVMFLNKFHKIKLKINYILISEDDM